MDFALSEQQRMVRDVCCRFTREVISPRAAELDMANSYPYGIIRGMADLGMMGISFPEEYGGGGGDWVSAMLCMEEISRGDAGLGFMLDVTALCTHEIELFGTDEQKRCWLPPLVTGKEIGGFGLTEPDAGSDAGAISCRAALDGNQWLINGRKQFISNMGLENSSAVVIAAVAGKSDSGNSIINSYIVPMGKPGFTVGRSYDKMGLHSCSTNELIFEDCRLEPDFQLGKKGRGLAQHLTMVQTGRVCIAACSVGLAQACLDASLAYARERKQFGKPLTEFEGISFKLSDMAVGIELARLMYLKAAWLKDRGLPYRFEAAAAKVYASEMVEKVASDAVQIHGGYGYTNDYAVSRYYRQAKAMQIVEGTSEVQRIVISRCL